MKDKQQVTEKELADAKQEVQKAQKEVREIKMDAIGVLLKSIAEKKPQYLNSKKNKRNKNKNKSTYGSY